MTYDERASLAKFIRRRNSAVYSTPSSRIPLFRYEPRDTRAIKATVSRTVIEIRLPVIHRENAFAPRFGNETGNRGGYWYREKLAHRTARTSRTLHSARGESRGQKQVPLISLKSVVPRERATPLWGWRLRRCPLGLLSKTDNTAR